MYYVVASCLTLQFESSVSTDYIKTHTYWLSCSLSKISDYLWNFYQDWCYNFTYFLKSVSSEKEKT